MNVSPAAQDFSMQDYRYRVGISIHFLSYCIQEAGSFGFGTIPIYFGHAVRKYVLGRAVFIDLAGYSDTVIETSLIFSRWHTTCTFYC